MNYIILEGPNGKREVEEDVPYRLEPGERVVGSRITNDVGLGDLITAITTTTGFKQWWEGLNGGPCTGCQEREAAANYIRFKGPEWLKAWIAESIRKE